MIEGYFRLDAPSSPANHHGEFCLIIERGRFRRSRDRITVSDQAGREARENFGVDRLFESAFLEVVIVVQTDTDDFRRLLHRRQDSNTDRLIFSVSALIDMISVAMSLEPGDVIITGTPGGVGAARKPPVFMRAGDVFEVEIQGMGVLSNSVQDE